MTSFARILTGAAGLAMVAGAAAPAAAQYAPGYGGYNPGYNTNNGGIGAVINQVLGGGRYGAYGQGNDRVAVDQCARAAEARVSQSNRANAGRNSGQRYNDPRYNDPRYGNQGYQQGYGYNGASMARVIGITQVERQRNGLKISGVIDSGMNHRVAYGQQGYPNQGYNPGYPNQGYGNAYGQNAQVADLRFSCRVDYRGQVANVDIKRNVAARRGY